MKKVQPEPKVERDGMMPREWVIIYVLIAVCVILSLTVLAR